MAFNRPLIKQEHLLFGGQPDPDEHHAGVSYIVERPAAGRIPELIRIIDDNEDDALPIYISSDEEEGDEELIVILDGDDDGENGAILSDDEGGDIPARPFNDEDELGNGSDEESDDEETDDSDEWGDSSDWTSEDSGYDTMSDEEEEDDDDDDDERDDGAEGDEEDEDGDDGAEGDEEDEDGDDGAEGDEEGEDSIRPLRFEDLPSPSCDTWSCLWDDDSSEEPTPSTSGFNSSTKRSREEDEGELDPGKRPRRSCEERVREEENSEEPTPSTSGLKSSTKRIWEGCWEVAAKRPRCFNDSDSD